MNDDSVAGTINPNSLRNRILAAAKKPPKMIGEPFMAPFENGTVPVGICKVKMDTIAEFNAKSQKGPVGARTTDIKASYPILVSGGACDPETGEMLFNKGEVQIVADTEWSFIESIATEILDRNGLGKKKDGTEGNGNGDSSATTDAA